MHLRLCHILVLNMQSQKSEGNKYTYQGFVCSLGLTEASNTSARIYRSVSVLPHLSPDSDINNLDLPRFRHSLNPTIEDD